MNTDLSSYSGRNDVCQIGSSATGDINSQYRASLPNQGITKSRQAPMRQEESTDNDAKTKVGNHMSHAAGQAHL